MKISYTLDYIKIYLWQGISVILNFIALFIVVPHLSLQPAVYGTYSVCVGMAIFLSYADLGFISAGSKYAAEAYARNEKEEEMRIVGFAGLILACFLLLLSLFFVYCSIFPENIISGLKTNEDREIASSLFLILGVSVPITLLQRLCQMILSIRLQDYVMQRISIVGSIIRITSVFYFFGSNKYDVVSYYFFSQIILFIVPIITIIFIHRKFQYDFARLFRYFSFNKEIFNRIKYIAFSSLFMMVSWIIYYEMDSLVIGKFFGVEQVSIYAIGATLLSFFRSILGIIFSPFSVRFNHFVGLKDSIGLQHFYLYVVKFMTPFVVFPILCIVILAPPFVLSWVGEEYENSIHLVQWLLMSNLFAFLSYPSGFLLISLEKIKEIYWISALIPIIYWIGILIVYPYCGIVAFGIFKCIAFYASVSVYFCMSCNFLGISKFYFFITLLKSVGISLPILVVLSYLCRVYLPVFKSLENLSIVLCTITSILLLTFMIQIFTSKDLRTKCWSIFNVIKSLV